MRSAANVEAEMARAKSHFPQVQEFFFDDDTFTDDLPRAEEIARRLGRLGITWSCNAKANVPPRTLEVLRDNGLRLLLVGYESGNQQILNNIKKGLRLDVARQFTRHAKALGIKIRDVHPRASRRDAGDHPGDDPVRVRDRARHHPGLAHGAVSRDRALPTGAGAGVAAEGLG